MSNWSYIHGTIVVSPMGRTQAEKRYILETVLNHLPQVYGSEGNMDVYVIQKNGTNMSSSSDEFGEDTNNLDRGWLRVQTEYILVVDGSLRDTVAKETYRSFQNWLCRLAKRMDISDVQVKITDYFDKFIVDDASSYREMFEEPSWSDEDSKNWCEYLMWDYPRDNEGNLLRGKPEN